MPIHVCDSFWLDSLLGKHDFSTHSYKCALYNSDADLNHLSLTAYTATNEITGTGYTAGGVTVSVSSGYPKLELIGDRYHACVRFGDANWADGLTVSDVAQALIYNATTSGNPAVVVFTFAEPLTIVSGSLNITIPITQRPVINIKAGGSDVG
jgi:hypothetical protein